MYDYGYNNYYYTTSYNNDSGILSAILAMGAVVWVIAMAVSVLMVISMWKIFKKNGKEGWIALIPFYNIWTFFEICNIPGWMIFIPFANIVYMYIAYYRISIKMGKGSGFGVLCIFFPVVCLPILAFSKTQVATPNVNVNNYTQPAPAPVYQQPVNPEPVNQQPVNPEPVYQQPVNPEPVNQAPVNPEPVYQQPVQQPVTVEPVVNVVNEPVQPTQQPVADMNATMINPQPINNQPVETLNANEGFKFCTNCGNKCAMNMKFCDNCGKEFDI